MFVLILFVSCAITTPYQRPANLPLNGLFRAPFSDSTRNYASVPVSAFYNDSLLQNLITEALDSNIDVRLALNRLAQAAEYVKQSKAAFFPTLNFGLSQSVSNVSKYGNSTYPNNPPITELKLAATTSWEADIWGKLSSIKRSQQAQYLEQEAAVRAIQTQIVATVASAYYQLITLDRQKSVTEQSIDNYTTYLQTVETMKQSAQVNEVAVLQAKAQLASAKAYLPQINASIAAEENNICLLLGKTPAPVERSDTYDLTIFHAELMTVGIPAQLLSNRPDVQAAEYALCASHEMFNAARAAMYPQLTLTGAIGPDAKGLSNWLNMPGSLLWNAMLGLAQPVFNGRTLKTQKEIAKLQQDAAFLQFKQTLLNAGNEVSNALAAIHFTSQQAIYQKEQVDALKTAYEYSQELLVNGYATYLDVLSAQTNALTNELSLYETYNNIIQQKIILYRALGGGWK